MVCMLQALPLLSPRAYLLCLTAKHLAAGFLPALFMPLCMPVELACVDVMDEKVKLQVQACEDIATWLCFLRGMVSYPFLRLRMLLNLTGQAGGSETEGWHATLGHCLLQVFYEPEEVRHRVHKAFQLPPSAVCPMGTFTVSRLPLEGDQPLTNTAHQMLPMLPSHC